jgi:hypothetical protein
VGELPAQRETDPSPEGRSHTPSLAEYALYFHPSRYKF